MLFESLLLGKHVVLRVLVVLLARSLVINILSGAEQSLFLFFQAQLGIPNLNSQVSVSAFSVFNSFSGFIVVIAHAFVVVAQVAVVLRLLNVGGLHRVALTICLIHLVLFGGDLLAKMVSSSLRVITTVVDARDVFFEAFGFVLLLGSLEVALVVLLVPGVDLAPHVSSLQFHAFDFSVDAFSLLSEVHHLAPSCRHVVLDFSSFNVLLVKESLGARELFLQVVMKFGPTESAILTYFSHNKNLRSSSCLRVSQKS